LKLKGIIFDLDSTLIQAHIDFESMKAEMIRLLESKGYDRGDLSPTQHTTVQILEKAREWWLEQGKPEEEWKNTLLEIEAIMNRGELKALANLTEIEGAREAVKTLKAKGLKLAILTRSCHQYAVEALRKLGLLDYFDVILGRNETPEPKPYKAAIDYTAHALGLEVGEVAMVGDHQIDWDSAQNSGCLFIGVGTGRRGLDSWRDQQPPPHFIPSIGSLPQYLEGLGLI